MLLPFNPPNVSLSLSSLLLPFPNSPLSLSPQLCPKSDFLSPLSRQNPGIMAFRERVKRALHRSNRNPKPNGNSNGIKIEYYRRHEIPPSKFRGPFDPDHQKMLAAYNLHTAQEDRPRSPDLSLSPCATLPPEYRPQPLDSSSESNPPSTLFNSMYCLLGYCISADI